MRAATGGHKRAHRGMPRDGARRASRAAAATNRQIIATRVDSVTAGAWTAASARTTGPASARHHAGGSVARWHSERVAVRCAGRDGHDGRELGQVGHTGHPGDGLLRLRKLKVVEDDVTADAQPRVEPLARAQPAQPLNENLLRIS